MSPIKVAYLHCQLQYCCKGAEHHWPAEAPPPDPPHWAAGHTTDSSLAESNRKLCLPGFIVIWLHCKHDPDVKADEDMRSLFLVHVKPK